MVVGREAEDCDRAPNPVRGGEVANVGEFLYLGSIVAADGRVDVDMERKISLHCYITHLEYYEYDYLRNNFADLTENTTHSIVVT